MRILFTSALRKPSVLLLSILVFTALLRDSLAADEKPEPRTIKASDTVEIVRIGVGLTQVLELEKNIKARFSEFESDFLFSISDSMPGLDQVTSNVAFGQCVGVVLPDLENYFGVAVPLEIRDIFEEDYEIGEDADGNTLIDGQVAVKSDRYLGYTEVPEEVQFENSTQVSRQLMDFASQSENDLLTIESFPITMGRSLLKGPLRAFGIALDTAAQRRDDESDIEYSYRSLTSGHLAKLMELFFRDVERVRFCASSSDSEHPFSFEVVVDCRKKSELLTYFQELQRRRNRSLSWLHPNACSFATIALGLPERIQEQLLSAGKATAVGIQEAGLGANAIAQTEGVFRGLAESGAFEALLQQVPFDEESTCYVGVLPLASGSVFDSELVQLVSAQDSLTTITEVDGWPIYSADGWLDLELEEGWVPYVVATDSMLSLMVLQEADKEKGVALLTELIQREFSPARQGARYANAIFAAEFSFSDVVNFSGNDGDDWSTLLPDNAETNESGNRIQLDQDRVLWSIGLDQNQVTAKCHFQPNSVTFGVLSFETLTEVISGIVDF
ncbi:MAG: hypothetical protein ABJZ55_06775 [Fuerstiella sp.]